MQRVALASLALLISACTTEVEDLIPQDGPTMVDIYNSHLQRAGQGRSTEDALGAARRGAVEGAGATAPQQDPLSYTRSVANETDNLFPALENPALIMHVFPHLAGDERLPVPGYSTSFSLFEKTEFALPGEVAVPAHSSKEKTGIRIIGGSADEPASSAIRSF